MTVMSSDGQSPATQEFAKLHNKYKNFAEEIERILEDALIEADIKCQAIESRAKSVDSFDIKCKKTNSTGALKYTDPMRQITDLAGVRVITYTLGDVGRVCAFLEKYFIVEEKKDIGEERLESGKFGYQSIHYLCQLNDNRLALPEFARFRDMICEIQVRTVLQHVWAQIEHGMQYKASSALPNLIKKKFTSLAGLLEIGDREFQSIETEFERLKDAVRSDFEADLTKVAFGNKDNLSTTNGIAVSGASPQEAIGIRDLVASGRYSEAISAYDANLAVQPKSVTLYLGRAKAKFLSGDAAGAEKDIKFAESLQPNNKDVAFLREKIIEGNNRSSNLTIDLTKSNILTNAGHNAMKSGDGELAYIKYSEAEDMGASRPFSILNRAMACILASDFSGASNLLNGLQIRPGTPMEINILALKVVLAQLSGDDSYQLLVEPLQEAVTRKGDFSFQLSPLNLLEAGLRAKPSSENKHKVVSNVFKSLMAGDVSGVDTSD
jgi:ppGpp synthetase/RelA/SpoT-type nucleotidyltranferase/Tfp pilus assembly protein PilF